MITVVLPTAAIVHDHKNFEMLFSFYEGGLRGVVRDMVMVSDQLPPGKHPSSAEIKEQFHNSGLFDKIMQEYAHSPEALFLAHTTNNDDHTAYVELVIEVIYQAVVEMMNSLFMRTVFEVCKQRCDWVGNDLIAFIQVLEKRPKQ